jgi:hypothetical protein
MKTLSFGLLALLLITSCNPNQKEVSLVTTATSEMTMVEGSLQTFKVHLSSKPKGPVTLNLSSSKPELLRVEPPTITFRPNNWDVDHMVVVTAVENSDLGNNTVQINLGGEKVTQFSSTVNINDNDFSGTIAILTGAVKTNNLPELNVTEGTPVSLPVRLSGPPRENVTISYVCNAPVNIGPSTLTFTPSNWNVDQYLTLTPIDDEDDEGNRGILRLNGPGMEVEAVSVYVRDDENILFNINKPTVTMIQGQTTTIEVSLSRPPTRMSEIFISHEDPLIVSASPYQFYFTPTNWNVPQTITLTAKKVTTKPVSIAFTGDWLNGMTFDVWVTVVPQ